MPVRKSNIFLAFLGVCSLGLAGLFAYSAHRVETDRAEIARLYESVRELGLTDLCLFSEARYTRNPSQADRHAAFQDHPMALEHFPAGSLVQPPPRTDEKRK